MSHVDNALNEHYKELRKMLSKRLQENILKITFTKKDGTERTMLCTLKSGHIPHGELVGHTECGDPIYMIKESTRTKAKNDEVLSVWDIENNGWRSFRLDSVIKVEGP